MKADPRLEAIEAQQFLNATLEQLPEEAVRVISKSSLTQAGLHYWPHTYQGRAPDESLDYDAIDGYYDWLRQLLVDDPVQGIYQYQLTQIPDQKIAIMASARWVDAGLPTFRLGHKKAAALMATTISKDSLSHVKPPWPAFFIEMPDGLLELKDGERRASVRGVIVHTVFHPEGRGGINKGLCWTWMALTDTALVQWHLNATPEILVGKEESDDFWHGVGLDYDDYDKKVEVLVGRLIVALCLMRSDPAQFKERQEVYKPVEYRNKKKAPQGAPNYRVFVDARPIEVDVRPALHSYLKGERNALPSVRTLVSGHLKLQPHGPHNSLRKLIWREPYWSRGLEGAPIAKRTVDIE